MRKSIGAATAALVVAGTAFMACGGPSEYEPDYDEQMRQHANAHALMNCTRTEVLLRERQGVEVTGEDRWEIEIECRRSLARIDR